MVRTRKQPIEWSDKHYRDMIVEQRKFLWPEDYVEILAKWMGLVQGMTAVDVGCGLGYLGYTYWPYFGKKGKYIGIDCSENLLKDAASAARDWAKGGKTEFIKADAYKLPLHDDSVDWVMCQTLLMHLKEPERALGEMIRILKPGGLIMCKEPDNLSAVLQIGFNSYPKMTLDNRLFLMKYNILCCKGSIKLGRGDWGIGARVPHMLTQLGMKEIDARQNDNVRMLEPPYESEKQQHQYQMELKSLTDAEVRALRLKEGRELFLAGGGTQEEYKRLLRLTRRIRAVVKRQFIEKKYYGLMAPSFFIIKARKPKIA